MPQCLLHVCECSAIKSFIRLSEELEQMLLLPGEIEHQEPLPMVREEQQVQADEIMENPRAVGCCNGSVV
jgi:hypothetical protein